MRLSDALRVGPGQVIAFVGAGGKSTAIKRLVTELEGETPVLVTTTTKLAKGQNDLASTHLILGPSDQVSHLPEFIQTKGSVLLTSDLSPEEPKWLAPEANSIQRACELAKALGAVVLIEADGARGLSLKAPAAHEPQIPSYVDSVVIVAGIDSLGAPLGERMVHRHSLVADIVDLDIGKLIEIKHLVRLISSSKGGLKGIPSSAVISVLLNKTHTTTELSAGGEIAKGVLAERRIRRILLASVAEEMPVREVWGKVAGIVLAAGASTRLDHSKQLVNYRGKPLVWHAIEAARGGGCSPIILVLGADAEAIRSGLAEDDVLIIMNENWKDGQSTSIKTGLGLIEGDVEGVVFLLSDMPFVDEGIVRALIEEHRLTLAPIIAPKVANKFRNPALFDCLAFPRLMEISGDVGGRQLFAEFPVRELTWDQDIWLDVDTPADLLRLKEME